MILTMSELPDGVIGFTAIGKVTGRDYETVVVPALEEGFKQHSSLSLIYHLGPEFEGFEAAAMWDDAKVGLKHLTSWDRVAVVTEVPWIRTTAKTFGFVMPCRVRVFSNEDLGEAREWACISDTPGLELKILQEQKVAILTATKALRATDFERAAASIDAHIAKHGALQGIMIRAAGFSGWEGLNGLISHLRFVRDHHKRVRRVAIVTDGAVISHLPSIARHFVTAKVQHFPEAKEIAALTWLEQGSPQASSS